MVIAQKDAVGDPIEQTVRHHQIVRQIRVAVEGLREELLSVEGVDRRDNVASGVLQERCQRTASGGIGCRQVDGRVCDR